MNQVTLKPINVHAPEFERVVDLFCTTFIRDHYSERDFFQGKANIMKHAHFPGFKGGMAVTGEGEVIGFAYGFTSHRGQFFRSQLENVLTEEEGQAWLSDSFEVVELAVRPSFRGRGIGSALHDALLENLPHQRAFLAVSPDNLRAIRLYRRKGWSVKKESTVVIPGIGSHMILGKELQGDCLVSTGLGLQGIGES